MGSGLENLLAEGVISEVLGRLKSGKEAEVYVVRFGGKVVAAKVYKDRATRSFKSNAAYKEGRTVRNTRSQRAMDRGSKFGQAASEDAWKSAEVDALYKLHAAGVRVPTPVMYLDGVLLMELVLDADGEAAPRVIDAHISVEDANRAYFDMLGQLVKILCCDMIHGDLSPYNVLWSPNGPTIIDFPQTISASHNSRSESFFVRDARNILGYFASIDQSLDGRVGDASEIWRAYVRRELTPDFLPTVRARPALRAMPPRGRTFDPRPHSPNPTHSTARGPQHHGAAPNGARPTQGAQGPRPMHDARPSHEPRGQGAPRPHPEHRQEPRPRHHEAPAPPPAPRVNAPAAAAPLPVPANANATPMAAPPVHGSASANAHHPPPHAPSPRPEARRANRGAPNPEVIVRVNRAPAVDDRPAAPNGGHAHGPQRPQHPPRRRPSGR